MILIEVHTYHFILPETTTSYCEEIALSLQQKTGIEGYIFYAEIMLIFVSFDEFIFFTCQLHHTCL